MTQTNFIFCSNGGETPRSSSSKVLQDLQGIGFENRLGKCVIDKGLIPCDRVTLLEALNLKTDSWKAKVEVIEQSYKIPLTLNPASRYLSHVIMGMLCKRDSEFYRVSSGAALSDKSHSVYYLQAVSHEALGKLHRDETNLLHFWPSNNVNQPACDQVKPGILVQKTGLVTGTTYGYIEDMRYDSCKSQKENGRSSSRFDLAAHKAVCPVMK